MRSIEMLQLALLGVALLLVAARLRVLALRRRAADGSPRRRAHRPDQARVRRPAPAPARRVDPPAARRGKRDEWPFPDPSAPAPTGLLPSTASARRRAREPAVSGDRR
jgi:hypothetical protein